MYNVLLKYNLNDLTSFATNYLHPKSQNKCLKTRSNVLEIFVEWGTIEFFWKTMNQKWLLRVVQFCLLGPKLKISVEIKLSNDIFNISKTDSQKTIALINMIFIYHCQHLWMLTKLPLLCDWAELQWFFRIIKYLINYCSSLLLLITNTIVSCDDVIAKQEYSTQKHLLYPLLVSLINKNILW